MSFADDGAKKAHHDGATFGLRKAFAADYLARADQQIEKLAGILADVSRALHRREVGAAQWQAERALKAAEHARAAIGEALGALDTDHGRRPAPF